MADVGIDIADQQPQRWTEDRVREADVVGCVTANLMFGLPAVTGSTADRSAGHLWFAEVIATLGLVLVIFAAVRTGRRSSVPFAVGGYIAGACCFTSSTGFANPAVTIARALTDTFTGIAPASVPPFIAAQLVGAAVGFLLIRVLVPDPVRVVDPAAGVGHEEPHRGGTPHDQRTW